MITDCSVAYLTAVPEDKSCELTANTVAVPNKDNTGAEAQAYNDEIPVKLGQLDGDRIGSLANVLAELLQHEDSCSGDSRKLTNSKCRRCSGCVPASPADVLSSFLDLALRF